MYTFKLEIQSIWLQIAEFFRQTSQIVAISDWANTYLDLSETEPNSLKTNFSDDANILSCSECIPYNSTKCSHY